MLETPEPPDAPADRELVGVFKARSPSEAAFYATALSEAGIPAVAQGEALASLAGGYLPGVFFRVCVPRGREAEARALLADRAALARAVQDESIEPADASGREAALREAFARNEALSVPDPRAPSDPLLTEMARLSALPKGERREALEPYLRAWIEEGAGPLTAAKYLAAAGLSLEEAADLEHGVRARLHTLTRAQGRARVAGGLALWAAAGALGWFKLLPIWGLLCVAFGIGGAVVFLDGIRLLRRLTPPGA
ncbi:MAG: DUF2007 domain-containing protein [Planctomycetota bacterium]|nr:DUF2007 domain-containing protein [Planctomycetota bacterium]